MQERNNEITIISKTMMNVQDIVQETSALTYEQGEHLDAIGEHIFGTYRNVDEAREQLIEANEHHQRARRKYVYFSLMLLIGVAVGLLLLLG
jgi:syntaxin 16